MNVNLLIQELRRDEGVRRDKYADTLGIETVGVGHNCKASPLPSTWACPLTDEQVDALLTADVAKVCAGLDKAIPWWRDLDEVRQRVLANMAFNMGVQGLLGFKNTLAAIQAGRYDDASVGLLASKWATQVRGRAQRLAYAMRTGAMP